MEQLNNNADNSFSELKNNLSLLNKLIFNMNFVGMAIIIYGVINCLTLIGAIIGIPLIIMGLRLRESASSYEMFKLTGEPSSLINAIQKQDEYFNIHKILIIIFLVLALISIILVISALSFAINFLQDSGYDIMTLL